MVEMLYSFFLKFESKMGVGGGIIKFKFDLLVKID